MSLDQNVEAIDANALLTPVARVKDAWMERQPGIRLKSFIFFSFSIVLSLYLRFISFLVVVVPSTIFVRLSSASFTLSLSSSYYFNIPLVNRLRAV